MNNSISPTRIAVVDGEILLRDLLCRNLALSDGLEIAWTADSVGDALPRLQDSEPDVLLVDIDPRNGNFFDLTRSVRRHRPNTKVIVLTNNAVDAYIERAQKLKINGYILKTDSLEVVIDAVNLAVQGGVGYSNTIRQRLRFDPTTRELQLPYTCQSANLTERELEVLRHLASGEAVKNVAKKLHITPKSVESHKYRIMRKLNLHNRVELARFAIREGLATA